MKNILFICTGNACRSPLAETILRKMLDEENIADITVSSAGTCNWGTNPRDAKMKEVAAEHGYLMKGVTTPFTKSIVDTADLIIVMEQMHYNEVTRLLDYTHWNRIHLFMEYAFGHDRLLPDPSNSDGQVYKYTLLPDPSGSTKSVYEYVFDTVENGCRAIFTKITGKTVKMKDKPVPKDTDTRNESEYYL